MKKYIDSFFRYRFLLKELVVKGIRLKYRRSYLGLVWTLLEPLLTSVVLNLVFGTFFHREGDALPFIIYILSGRLIYSCFSSSTKIAMRSIRANQAMIKKVYVPKYLYPLSSVIYNYILFLLSLIVLAMMMVYKGVYPTWTIIEIFIPLIILFIMSIGTGLLLATVCVFFRDLEYLWDVILMLIMYCSGIFYYVNRMGADIARFIKLNPLYCVINNVRVLVAGHDLFTYYDNGVSQLMMMGYSFGFSVIVFVAGVLLFKKHQDKFILHI